MTTWGKWTVGRKINAIQAAWHDGMSASELASAISKEHGIELSRGAVIGVYHRVSSRAKADQGVDALKKYPLLKPSGQSAAQIAAKREAERRRQEKRRAAQLEKQASAKVQVIETQAFDDLPDEGYGKHLTLVKDGCLWPTSRDERGTLFCNRSRRLGKHYCDRHYDRSVRGFG